MNIPDTGRRKALFIIDVQPAFINTRNNHIIDAIISIIQTVPYDLYVEALFHAEKGSVWDTQQQWTYPKDKHFHTVEKLTLELNDRGISRVKIEKETKSVFKDSQDLLEKLRQNYIQEVHLVGLDTNDCVLASAYEAFDLGFFTYVLEEGCESSSSADLHKQALFLLRKQNMTNNSCLEKIRGVEFTKKS